MFNISYFSTKLSWIALIGQNYQVALHSWSSVGHVYTHIIPFSSWKLSIHACKNSQIEYIEYSAIIQRNKWDNLVTLLWGDYMSDVINVWRKAQSTIYGTLLYLYTTSLVQSTISILHLHWLDRGAGYIVAIS